jgi:hypothetical protein
MAPDDLVAGDEASRMKASRVGRRALRGGRHAVRAVARRPMPIAAFGVVAATVLGLGALTAADIHSMDQLGNRPSPFGSHQFDQRQLPQQFDPQFHPLGNWPSGGHHH